MTTGLEARIRELLTQTLHPVELEVVNESHLHAGHRNSPGTGESHFRVFIVSPAFTGLTRLERHRRVNEALAEPLRNGVHALAVRAYAPGEAPDF